MNEHLLKAMVELFALLSNIENLSNTKKVVPFSALQESLEKKLKLLMARKSHVQWYLNQELSADSVSAYIQTYDTLMESKYQISVTSNQISIAPFDYNTVYALAGKLNKGLTNHQKMVVFIRLMEYVLIDRESRESGYPVFIIITEIFNFKDSFLRNVLDFICSTNESIINNPNLLYADGNCENINHFDENINSYKQKRFDGIREKLLFLSLKPSNLFALKYFGAGLTLNGHLINQGRIYIFTPGSKITCSDTTPIYYSLINGEFNLRNEVEDVILVAEKLEYKFKNAHIGIRGINISEHTGTLVGIMGGSGSGKSTLLNVLNGNLIPSKGKVTINGIDVHAESGKLEGIIGYVSQDDLLLEDLTVYQNLYYNSKLCFANLSDNEIDEKVNDLLANLGLAEAAQLKVGSPLEKIISGGQRKRLNIALELIRKPKVLYIDEPTSGLSSRDSENIMDFIKELSLKGQLIFVVIHQPSSDIFKMFDRMIILDIGGYPIFYGNPLDSLNYFKRKIDHVKSEESECPVCGNVNPEVIFEIIESKILDNYGNVTKTRSIQPEKWYEYYKQDIEPQIKVDKRDHPLPEINFKKPTVFGQFYVFFIRDVLSKLKNRQYVLINFLEAPALSFLLAFFLKYFPTDELSYKTYNYFENSNIPVFIFISVVVALFLGLSVSAEEIIRDRKIRKREAFLNLSKGSYYGSKIIYLFILSAIQMAAFVFVGNSLLEIKGMFFDYWLMLFSTAAFSNMLGLNISASFKSVVTVYIIIPFLIIPQIIFSGVLVPFEELNPIATDQEKVPIIGELMVSRWAFEGLAVNQFIENEYERGFYDINKQITHAHFIKNYWIPELKNANNFIHNHFDDPKYHKRVTNDFSMLYAELLKHKKRYDYTGFSLMEDLRKNKYSPKLFKELDDYLNQMKKYYNKYYNNLIFEKDNQIMALLKDKENKNQFFNSLRRNYYNESLNDIVTNRNEVKKIVKIKDKLLQRENIIYLDSEGFRSPYFSPSKKIGNLQIKTYWANLGVIWLICIALSIILYYDVFNKINDFFGFFRKKIPLRV